VTGLAPRPFRFLSLFSGIEAASVAWKPLGWDCVGVAEVEPFPCSLLQHHYPAVPNLGDVTRITEKQIKQLGHIDLVVMGSPCTDVSIAGQRKGFHHADGTATRSGLFFTGMQIFHWAERHCDTRFLLLENVPGLFSSNKGRDFAAVVGQMAGLEDVPVPRHGWGSEGVAVGDNGMLEWCVLDAQWAGLAQRRKRVFALLDTGDWASRPPILLEPEGLRGDSPPSREAGQGVTGTLEASAGASRGAGTPHSVLATGGCWWDGGQVSQTLDAVLSKGQAMPEKNRFPAVLQPVTHSLRADGFDASEDGTGRGTPLVPVAFDTTQVTSKANRSNPKPGDPCHPLASTAHPPAIAFSCKDRGADASEIAPTLRAMAHSSSHPNAGGQVAVAIQMAVRRITPLEAERLQGAPDNYTLVPHRGKPAADGPRYKGLGNSFAVPCIRWIGQRIELALELAA